MGNVNDPFYDPTALVAGAAAKGMPIIFAAMNYRVNGTSCLPAALGNGVNTKSDGILEVFGFANSQALREEGSLNSGLLDQRLALEWIQSNIHYFGGNGSAITIFGQSDGGTSVGLHMTANGGTGNVPFSRAIMESGSAAADPGVSGNFTVVSTSAVAGLAGCSNSSDSNATLACLRSLPMQTLLQGVLEYENQTGAAGMEQDIFFPCVDGQYIPAPPSQLLKQGRFHNHIPVIAGWAEDDGTIFTSPAVSNQSAVVAYLNIQYPHLSKDTIQRLLQLYPVDDFRARAAAANNSNVTPYFFQSAQIYRDINFACPALDTAFRVAAFGSSAYLYALNQSALATLLELAGVTYYGVIHVSDVPYVFDSVASVLGSASDVALANRMSGSWVAFARTGNPVAGNQTLNDWSLAFGAHQSSLLAQASKNASVMASSAQVRVIGGPAGGMATYGLGGPEHLIQRCSFINSESFYGQIQT